MIDEDLRNLMPVEHRLPEHRKQQLKERIVREIQTGHESTPQRRYPKRRLVGGLVAATVLVAGTATAAAIWLGGPDPEQAREVVDKMPDPVAERYLDDWRPSLRSESVACVEAGSDKLTDARETGNTFASEFPLADLLTTDLLIKECTSGNDSAGNQGGFDPDKATACVREGAYPLAVVALDGLSCAETGDNIRPIRDGDLSQLNEMRAFEVAVLAIPEKCPTFDQAAEWARKQIITRDEKLALETIPGNPDGCFGGTTYWEQGKVIVERISGPATNEASGPSASTATHPVGDEENSGD